MNSRAVRNPRFFSSAISHNSMRSFFTKPSNLVKNATASLPEISPFLSASAAWNHSVKYWSKVLVEMAAGEDAMVPWWCSAMT